ncbi:MAG: GTPase, partial [Patescibacteria group bacterium]
FGDSNRKTGAVAPDLYLQVPKGTSFTDVATGEVIELTEENSPLLLVKGGAGGRGNDAFKTSINRVPYESEPGEAGQVKDLKMVLRLIADYGLIGLPNAGKSSLLNELTAAHVRTANYPFTTLEPNLGVLDEKVIADIPGLIEGASEGKGLGIKFLKHIEKVKLLIHCISIESEDIEKEYHTVRNELGSYNENLLKKNSILLLTKIDLVDPKEITKKLKILKKYNKEVYPMSIFDVDAIALLKKKISEE